MHFHYNISQKRKQLAGQKIENKKYPPLSFSEEGISINPMLRTQEKKCYQKNPPIDTGFTLNVTSEGSNPFCFE